MRQRTRRGQVHNYMKLSSLSSSSSSSSSSPSSPWLTSFAASLLVLFSSTTTSVSTRTPSLIRSYSTVAVTAFVQVPSSTTTSTSRLFSRAPGSTTSTRSRTCSANQKIYNPLSVSSAYTNHPSRIVTKPSILSRMDSTLTSSSISALNTASINTDTSMSSTTTSFDALASRIDNSWIRELSSETIINLQKSLQEEGKTGGNLRTNNNTNSNKFRRQVFNGHYVLVEPTGIQNPELILYSPDVAYNMLQMLPEQVSSPDFTKWLSGNLPQFGLSQSWATPYALSIVGTRYTNNCPYGTGNGYGDGRAVSIAELTVTTTPNTVDETTIKSHTKIDPIYDRYELQLKGSGKTPFCRGADGRAILRSSVREFLASEAMYNLNVPTTRALSLIVSKTETVPRPWYTDGTKLKLPERTDPRLDRYTEEQKKELVSQLRESSRADPNIMQNEPVAITCRVSPSFTRIGHFDLFARRVEKQRLASPTPTLYDTSTIEYQELEQLVWHACQREYNAIAYQPNIASNDIVSAATTLLKQSAIAISSMIGHWIRVGFVQGNFNADNNLIAGRTMDYGPFGYVEEYNPIAAKWTGSGDHFGFLNQPTAGLYNYKILVESIIPVIIARTIEQQQQEDGTTTSSTDPDTLVESFMDDAGQVFQNAIDETFRIKIGFERTDTTGDAIWRKLEPLLRSSRTDWTIFFRSLTYSIRDFPLPSTVDTDDNDTTIETNDKYLYNQILAALDGTMVDSVNDDSKRDYPGSFYEPLTTKQTQEWIEWIGLWRNALIQSKRTSDDIYNDMKYTNPKYILREWMLVHSYKQAQPPFWNFNEIHNLFDLIQNPYEEGTTEQIQQYYKRASDDELVSGGTAFMSCSS